MAAISARRKPAGADRAADLEARLADAEQMITLLMRVANRAIVRYSRGATSASYRQIVVGEMRLASHEEAAEIERWLTEHHGS